MSKLSSIFSEATGVKLSDAISGVAKLGNAKKTAANSGLIIVGVLVAGVVIFIMLRKK